VKGNPMALPVLLAHGALGPFDEIILIGVAVVFLIMMAVSWLKSRNIAPDEEDESLETPVSAATDQPDRFRLD
jgi:hypothetical protein